MKTNSNPILIVMGIILIALGIGSFFGYRIFPTNKIMIIADFVVAALILLLVLMGKVKENVGMFVMMLWLVLMGLMAQFNLNFAYSGLILDILPVAAGLFMLVGL
jgi:hypothetical protein